jgi:hypothetical protein
MIAMLAGTADKRKNLAGEVLLTVTALIGTASVAVTQLVEVRLVTVCNT